jgi:hypothetical protein
MRALAQQPAAAPMSPPPPPTITLTLSLMHIREKLAFFAQRKLSCATAPESLSNTPVFAFWHLQIILISIIPWVTKVNVKKVNPHEREKRLILHVSQEKESTQGMFFAHNSLFFPLIINEHSARICSFIIFTLLST